MTKPTTATERAMAAIAPDRSLDDMAAQLKAHPERPVVLYLSGVHENGLRCSFCVDFENKQLATLQKHKDSSLLVKHEISLTPEAFFQLADGLHATLSTDGTLTDARTKVSAPVGTPMLLQLGLDAQGSIEVKAVRGGDGDLDRWLTGLEASGKAHRQARDALSGCQIGDAANCSSDSKAPPITAANAAKNVSGAQR